MNAIQLLNKAEMTELDLLIASELENDANAHNLIPIRLKIGPGGINKFITDDGFSSDKLSVIVPISQIARGYWAGEGNNRPPLCSSPDGISGKVDAATLDDQFNEAADQHIVHPAIKAVGSKGTIKEQYECASCPLNQWGSSAKGRGKACKEMRRLVVILDGWNAPALLTLPPTSLKVWDTFCSTLRAQKGAYFATRAELTLERMKSNDGNAYSVLSVKKIGALTKDEIGAVVAMRGEYRTFVETLPVDNDDYVTADSTAGSDDEMPF